MTFDIDANGILKVTARIRPLAAARISPSPPPPVFQMTKSNQMKTEAEQHAAEDAQRKSLIEARNNADSSIYTAEKA